MKKLTKREKLEKKLDKLILQKSELLEKGKEYNGFVGFMKAIDEKPIKGTGKAALVETIDKYLDIEKNTKQYTWIINGIRSEMHKENKRKISDMQMFFLSSLATICEESNKQETITTKTMLLKQMHLLNDKFNMVNEKTKESIYHEMRFYFKVLDFKLNTVYDQYFDLLYKEFFVPLNNAITTANRNAENKDKFFPFSFGKALGILDSDGLMREATPCEKELIDEAIEKDLYLPSVDDYNYKGKSYWEFQEIAKEALNQENVRYVLPSITIKKEEFDNQSKNYDGNVPFWSDNVLTSQSLKSQLLSKMLKGFMETNPDEKTIAIFLTFLIMNHAERKKKYDSMFYIMDKAMCCSKAIISTSMIEENKKEYSRTIPRFKSTKK